MNCPRCNIVFKKTEAINKPFRIYVEECNRCSSWWFDSKKMLEEYRASILPTSQYTVLPELKQISTQQVPAKCCCCEQNTLFSNNLDSYIIQHCSNCSGIFLSKEQVLGLVKMEKNPIFEAFVGLDILMLLLSIFRN